MNEASKFVLQYIDWFTAIISAGAVTMVTYQAVRKSLSDDEYVIADCNTKMKNAIYAAVIALSITGLITIFKSYYGW